MQIYEKETLTQVFFREYCEFFKNTYYEEHLRRTLKKLAASVLAPLFNADYLLTVRTVLGQLPPRKNTIVPNRNQGSIFLLGNCLVAPNPKTNPNLDRNPNPKRGAIFLGGQLCGYRYELISKKIYSC